MKLTAYKEIMAILDLIEIELNNIAEKVGHDSFNEFMSKRVDKINFEYLKAA